MFSYLYYAAYGLLAICAPWGVFASSPILVLIAATFLVQFNVTAFLDIGLTISFFELYLLLASFNILLVRIYKVNIFKIKMFLQDRVFIYFFVFSLISIIVAYLRYTLGDLNPADEYAEIPVIRSVMSLSKTILFFFLLILVREYLLEHYDAAVLQKKFLLTLALSGIAPALAVWLEISGFGFWLIHNNPSFGQAYVVHEYLGYRRPVGLTNEASFFAYMLLFSYLATLEALKRGILNWMVGFFLSFVYISSVLLTVSRTGLVAFLVAYFVYNLNKLTRSRFFLIKVAMLGGIIAGVAKLNIEGFNVAERFFSTFRFGADLSTLERYGVTWALFELMLNKSLLLGVGIYNYMYYIKDYLPSWLGSISYDAGVAPPSFNFILQLFAEFGLPLASIFLGLCIWTLRRAKDRFVIAWFFFLFLFSLSFQTLNFSAPMLILLYPILRSSTTPIHSSRMLSEQHVSNVHG